MSAHPILPSGYGDWLKSLKSRIASARQRAALAVNQELVTLYHSIGKDILQRQAGEGWGARVIQRLSTDLGEAFPDMKGFSASNLKYMRFFAQSCPDLRIGQQPADQLPWFHIISLLTKIPDPAAREWYAIHAVSEGWSRPTLDSHIKSQLHLRQGGAVANFERHLPAPQARLAAAALKDPYLVPVPESAISSLISTDCSLDQRCGTRFFLKSSESGAKHQIRFAGAWFSHGLGVGFPHPP